MNRTRVLHKALAALLLLAAGVAILGAGAFYLTGGKSFTIQTPSMSEYAPVGTTVFSREVPFESIEVGDTIVFNPPASNSQYFHRVHSIDSSGGIHTKGDLNESVDPWVLHAEDIHGSESFRIIGLGWLIKALPIFLIGGILLWTLTHYYTVPIWVLPTRVVGLSFMAALSAFIIKPFVRADVISQTVAEGVATTVFVPTGLLPIKATAQGGSADVSYPGNLGSVMTSDQDPSGYFNVILTANLGFWGWVIQVAVWSIPTIIMIAYAFRVKKLYPEYFPSPAHRETAKV
jgi:hypothetical protein